MRHLKYIVLILLISACGNKKEPQDKNENRGTTTHSGVFSITEIKKDDFDKALESKSSTIIDTTIIQKHNGQIRLPIHSDQDPVLIYKDKKNPNNEEADITYSFIGYFKAINKYLLQTKYYESVTYDLISKDGSKTRIWNKPLFSKEGNFFVCISPYGLEGEPVGLQIWKVKADEYDTEDPFHLDKIFELNQLVFNPVDCRWDNQGALLIQAEKLQDNFYPKDPKETYYLKLLLR